MPNTYCSETVDVASVDRASEASGMKPEASTAETVANMPGSPIARRRAWSNFRLVENAEAAYMIVLVASIAASLVVK